jgi:signal peptidase I
MFAAFKGWRLWAVVVSVVLLLVVSAGFARIVMFRSFRSASGSMQPTLQEGDGFFADTSAYAGTTPQRGDVIVFRIPNEGATIFDKRVVGLPGDHIQFVKGVVRINGNPAQLRGMGMYKVDCTDFNCTNARQYLETLPGGHAHRIIRVEDDSPVEDSSVITVPPDSYFVAGDNRDNSRDSRMDDFGFVPRNTIVGRVEVKYFDGATKRVVWEHVQ